MNIRPGTVAGTFRLPFLILTPACLLLALAIAQDCCAPVSYFYFAVALMGAFAAHISVNAFNEYFDYRSGLDLATQRTPFSGGSGTLVHHPALAPQTLLFAIGSLVIVLGSGAFFISIHGLYLLLPIGLVGVLLITLYTTSIVKHPLLCLVAAGTGFALVMLIGTTVALTGTVPDSVLWVALPPFFVINNLLLLNQFPDIDADRQVGRRTLPVVIGHRRSALVYLLFALFAAAALAAGVVSSALPTMTLIALLPLALAVPVAYRAFSCGLQTERLLPFMAVNVAIAVLTPILIAAGIWLG